MSEDAEQAGDEVELLFEQGLDALARLGQTILDGRKPLAGPYAFFHHNSHSTTALRDCRRIVQRLREGRARLSLLAQREDALVQRDRCPDASIPPQRRDIMRQMNEAIELTKLDLESLYIFGGILLDQWSLQAMSIEGISCPKQHPFRELVDFLDQSPGSSLAPLWDRTRSDMLWLYYQLRFYRNRFIVHANRPWQRGTTMSVYGDDFNLFTPTPPGWLDDKTVDREIRALLHLAPDRIKNAPDDYWEKARPGRIIEVLFDIIPSFQRSDREKISTLFGKKGGSTPDFKVLATRLFRFVADGTEALIPISIENMSTIDLGPPHSTSQEMWARRSTDES